MAKVTVKRNDVENSPEKGIIVQNLVIRPVVRQSSDIEKWRNAIRAAEAINPILIPLFDLYKDIELDGVLTDLIDKRKLGVTKTRLKFVDNDGKDVPAMVELMKKHAFRQLRKEIQEFKIYGHKVIELINDEQGFRIFPIPQKHVKRKQGLITYEQYGNDGIYYREKPASNFIFEVGKWDDFGLLMKAAQYVIYKRGGFGDWSQYAELFGMPFREAKYDGFNETVRKQLEMAMDQAGSANYAITPKDTEFKLHQTRDTQGGGELYNTLRKACNEELSILFLGQTETTAKTAGKLGGNDDTHEQTEDDINLDDREDELAIFNEKIKPILANLGFPVDGGSFIHEPETKEVPVKDKVDNAIRLKKEAGLPIDDDYLYEMSGIPKPANYDALKKQQKVKQAEPPIPAPPSKKKNKGGQPQTADDEKLAWIDKLRLTLADFFDLAPKS
jgi:hypothetical protein